jgi:hypothetical protein
MKSYYALDTMSNAQDTKVIRGLSSIPKDLTLRSTTYLVIAKLPLKVLRVFFSLVSHEISLCH